MSFSISKIFTFFSPHHNSCVAFLPGDSEGRKAAPYCLSKELKTLCDHLRKRRLDLSLQQKDVSQILGVSEASIWYWEKNLTSPSLHHIPKIIEFLGYVPYEKSSQTLGQKLGNARRLSGITQNELAIRWGIDPGTLSNWEKGKGRPSEESLQTLSDLFPSFHLDTLKPRV